jgi:drug/metabolite transporter (DMT)-like permease
LRLRRDGTPRTAILYTTWAPFAALLGYLTLGETLSFAKIIGIGLVVTGISLAIVYRAPKNLSGSEEIQGSLSVGIVFGLLGGGCAAGAVFIARPVMAAGVDPALAAAIRAAAGLIGLLMVSRISGFEGRHRITPPIALRSAASGLLGMGVGMTLVLFALALVSERSAPSSRCMDWSGTRRLGRVSYFQWILSTQKAAEPGQSLGRDRKVATRPSEI